MNICAILIEIDDASSKNHNSMATTIDCAPGVTCTVPRRIVYVSKQKNAYSMRSRCMAVSIVNPTYLSAWG